MKSSNHPNSRLSDGSVPRVWVDTDIALGADRGDVDDGFALAALAAAHRKGTVELLGISTVFGNTTAACSEDCARELLRRAGVDVPVVRGAERAGDGSSASEAITAFGGNNMYIVALGPLTNLAAACRRDGELPARATLRVVGGNLSSRGFLPPLWPFEFNLARDREGARRVLSLSWKQLTLFPLDVVRRLTIGATKLQELERVSALSGYLAQQSGRWLERARWRHLARSFPLWDVPAALDAAGLLDCEIQVRRLAPASRRLTAVSYPLPCLADFDPEQAWQACRKLWADRAE